MTENLRVLTHMKAQIEKSANEVQSMQNELSSVVQNMNTLQSQLTENKLVKEELEDLEDGAKVFKLVGPALVPQELDEAKSTLSTRIAFISKELVAAREKVEKCEKDQNDKRAALLTAQQQFQALVQKTTAAR